MSDEQIKNLYHEHTENGYSHHEAVSLILEEGNLNAYRVEVLCEEAYLEEAPWNHQTYIDESAHM